jgi:hypothetical protein
MSDPKRIVETGSADVRALLGTAQKSMAPPAGAQEDVWRALQAKLPPPSGPGSPGGGPGAGTLPTGKLLVGGVALCALALAIFVLRTPSPAPNTLDTPAQTIAPATTTVATAAPTIALHVPQVVAVAATFEAPATVAPLRAAPVRPPVPSSSVPSPPDPEEEAAAVREARTALRQGDPSAALARLDGYERTHRGGILDQERAFLRIEAMRVSGDPRVNGKIEAFLKAYPDSPYRNRIQPK